MEKLLIAQIANIKLRCKLTAYKFKIDERDLYSAVLEKIWFSKEMFNHETGEVGFKKWLGYIIWTAAIDAYRFKIKHSRLISLDRTAEISDKENELAVKDYLDKLIILVKKKFTNQFIIFEMLMDGYQFNEIAKELKMPLGTVKSHVSRVRKQIR